MNLTPIKPPYRNPGPDGDPTPFSDLGASMVLLGQALQRGETTIHQLTELAKACGLTLHIRSVETARSQP